MKGKTDTHIQYILKTKKVIIGFDTCSIYTLLLLFQRHFGFAELRYNFLNFCMFCLLDLKYADKTSSKKLPYI